MSTMTADLKTSGKISLAEKLIYGSGQIGVNALFSFFSTFAMVFYTDVVKMDAGLIGTIILVSKIFDGFSDIIAGQLIDTSKHKMGHCIPVLMKWSIPMALSAALVFMLPDTSQAFQVVFIFVTYNLFNTVFYTYVSVAHNTLPSYVTDKPVERSQMLCYMMFFAAGTQTIVASTIRPLVAFFGGQDDRTSWVKAVGIIGVIGVVFFYLNVLFVKERVVNKAPSENIFKNVGTALKNKYWILSAVLQIFCSTMLMFNLTVSPYFLKVVAGDSSLIGKYIMLSNLPGVVGLIIVPMILTKVSKRSLVLCGGVIMLIAQIMLILGPAGDSNLILTTALIRGIGFAFPMGLVNAMTGDTIEYGEWKTGTRIQGVLFSVKSLASKIGQGVSVSVLGFVLAAVGYIGSTDEGVVQPASAISGIDAFFKYAQAGIIIGIIIIAFVWHLDKEMPQILKELEERKSQNT